MQNIIAAKFKVESEGYQAITSLSRKPVKDNSAIIEMALIKNENDEIVVCDTFKSGVHTTDDTLKGGLVGSLVGIIGGPIGVLLGGTTGALVGSVIDTDDAINTASMIETVASKMMGGEMALIVLAEETTEEDINEALKAYDVEILRFDAAVVAEEVVEAEKMQEELARQARAQLRAAKKDEHKQKIETQRAKLEADFKEYKEKFRASLEADFEEVKAKVNN